jgi:hypothetical protein
MACLHLNIPSVLNNYKELKEVFNSENVAYSLLSKNNEFGLEYTPKGESSELYKSLLNQTKDRSKALQLKAKYYTKSYLEKDNWIEKGVEPSIESKPLLEEFTISPLQKKLVQEIAQAKKERNNLEASGGRKLDINKLDNKIQDLQQRIEQLKNTEDLNDIYKEADIQLGEAKKLIDSGELSTHQFVSTLNKLQLWVTSGDFSTEDHLFLDEDLVNSDIIQEKFINIRGKAEKLLDELTRKGKNLLTNIVNEEFGTELTYDKIVSLGHKLGWFPTQGYSLNRVGHALAQFILKTVNEANDSANREAKTESRFLGELYNKVRASGFDIRNFYQQADKTVKGIVRKVFTGRLVHHFSDKYFKDRGRSGGSVDFRRNSEVMLNPYLLFDKNVPEGKKQDYIQEVYSNLGQLEGGQRIKEAQDKWEEFERVKNDHIALEYGDNELTREQETELETWIQQNSPISRIKFIESTKEKYLKNVVGKDTFLVTVPKRVINGKESGYYDERFKLIENNPTIYEFYKKAQEITKLAQKLFDFKDLTSTSLAFVEQDVLAKLSKNGVANFMKKELMDDILSSLLGGQNAKEEIDPITGKPIKKIRSSVQTIDKKIVSLFHAKQREYQVKNRDTKLTKEINDELYAEASDEIMNKTIFEAQNNSLYTSLNMLNYAALSFKHSSMIEDTVNLAMTYLPNSTVNTGDSIIDEKGNAVGEKYIQNLQDMVQHTLNTMYYKDVKKDTSSVLYHIYDEEQKKKLTALRIQLNNPKVPKEDKIKITEQIKQLQSESKRVTTNSLVKGLMSFLRLKGMGWNIPAAIANLAYGKITNMYKAFDGRMFGVKDWLKAEKAIFSDWGKFNKVVENYNIVGDVLYEFKQENKFEEKKNWFFKVIKAAKPYSMQTSTEKSNQGTVMIAMMLHQKVTNLKGETKSMWEAIDDNGKLSDEWSIDDKKGTNAIISMVAKIKSQVEEIHGDYSNALLIKSTMAGQSIAMFRLWFFEMFHSRFGAEKMDYIRNINTKGRYRTILELAKTYKLKPRAIYRAYKNGELSEVDMVNIRTNLAEFTTMAMSLALYAIVKAGLCGEEDKCKSASMTQLSLLNMANKINQDVAFYASPSAWKQFITNPTALTGMLGDISKLIVITSNEVFGTEEETIYQSGKHKGEKKIGTLIKSQIPFISSMERVKTYGDELIQQKN